MRDTAAWRKNLGDRLREGAKARGQQIDAPLIVQVELGLTLLAWVCPGEPAGSLWGLLGGYPLPVHGRQGWSAEVQRAVAVGRMLLAQERGRWNWQRMLKHYGEQPADFRLYEVDPSDTSFSRKEIAIAADRLETYRSALVTSPAHHVQKRPAAGPGTWRFRVGTRMQEVDMPSLPDFPPAPTVSLTGVVERPPIRVTFSDLFATASAMDAALGGDRYVTPMNNLRLEWVQADGSLNRVQEFTLDGVVNLVGMLGAGKSTLMDVLAVWAAGQGYHVTIVVGDTAAVLDRAAVFQTCGVAAAPLLGAKDRQGQLRKFHRTSQRPDTLPLEVSHQGFRWVATNCALDGLRQDELPLRPGEEPCSALLPIKDGDTQTSRPHTCPLLPVCPVQRRYLDLSAARIWVGTPQSLIYTQLPSALLPERVRLIELVYRTSDLVIMDEADRIQSQFDLAFMPEQTLVESRGGWLGELQTRVKGHSLYLSRRAVRDPEMADWLRALANADAAANRIYELLQQDAALRKWLGRSFFTGQSLFDRVIQSLLVDAANRGGEEESDDRLPRSELSVSFRRFADDPMGERPGEHHPTVKVLQEAAVALVSTDAEAVHQQLLPWLQGLQEAGKLPSSPQDAAQRLQLAIAVSVLDYHVDALLGSWNAAAAVFGLDDSGDGGFLPAPAEHSLVIPEAPMGNLLGFQYLSAPGDDAGPGLLRFFRCLGLGRWLLLRFPSLYRQLDGLAGPHSLLLSGTSWAPSDPDRYHVAGAPGYHLQLPVSGVLSVPEGQLPGLDGSRFYVAPQRQGDQAIIVSGQSPERRPGQLQLLVTKLAEPATGLLDRVLAQLPQQRQRVLLLVGSYDEVDLVADHLFRQRRDLSGAIVRLIADSEDETRDGIGLALHRGQVGRLASTGGRVLVAPLLAIERGHNILNEAGEAALGAVMFLVRPMPVPGDLAGPLHAVNAWAISHMEDQAWFKLHTGDPVRLGQAAAGFRKKAADLWRERLVQWGFLATKSPEERAELYWSQWIVHWQAIGRLLRGGVPAQVYFCDGAYVPNTARGRGADTVLSSVLAGYEDVLAAIAKHPIAERLYGPAIRALAQKELLPW